MRVREMTGQLVEGGHNRADARRIARECALRDDGNLEGGAKRREISDADRREARRKANDPNR